MELVAGHTAGFEVDVEKSAEFPGAVANDSAFRFETVVEGSVGESGLECDLNFVEPRGADEIEDVVEYFGRISVEAEDETAINGDAVGLNFGDRFFVAILLASFPIRVQFEALEAGAARTFQADEDLLQPESRMRPSSSSSWATLTSVSVNQRMFSFASSRKRAL